LRQHCPVDYNAFFALGDGKEDDFVAGHPLREMLQSHKVAAHEGGSND
jgi:hypothetical protein